MRFFSSDEFENDWNMKHYESVEFLSIFEYQAPPAQTQSLPIQNFLVTVQEWTMARVGK